MKRMLGIVLILIVLAAFTPLGCFAVDVTCTIGAELELTGGEGNDYTTYTLGNGCDGVTIRSIIISKNVSLDLNGKTLSANSVKCASNASSCSLTITGTGTLTVTGSIEVKDNLTISGGNVQAKLIHALNGTIDISGGQVTVTVSSGYGIKADNITIRGGQVTVNGSSGYGINADNDITISDGQVTVTRSLCGINADNDITISGGTVTATGSTFGIKANSVAISGEDTHVTATGSESFGIYAEKDITISGGTVEATRSLCGISANSVAISGGQVTASGNTLAVIGSVKNKFPGIGWTDIDGTEGRALIGLPSNPESGQDLSSYSYKKVQFPAPSATITFQVVNGAWDDENTEDQKVTLYSADGTTWTLPEDQIPAVGNMPSEGYQTGSWDPEEPTADMVITEDRTFTYTYTTDAMELPVEISVVQGNGEKGVPDDVKARTIRLTIRLKQNGELKLSSVPIELAVTPGGNREPAEFDAVTFMPDTPDFKESCGNYEYEVTVTPKEMKADIAGAGDDGPAWLLRAAAGSPDCEKFVLTLYWDSKTAAPAPEVIRVVALPEDEIGAYQLRADGTKEYLLFQTYDICMTYLGRDELCAGPERCYHK